MEAVAGIPARAAAGRVDIRLKFPADQSVRSN
jgi:hypothetical protein